tara:strand:+ start:64 stop:321 length:258 start_codon:yes stop_codon:yes gene_type:complete
VKKLILSTIIGTTLLASSAIASPFNSFGEGLQKDFLIYKPATQSEVTMEQACFGCISPSTGRPRMNFVSPHFRSNGTFVNGYWRS